MNEVLVAQIILYTAVQNNTILPVWRLTVYVHFHVKPNGSFNHSSASRAGVGMHGLSYSPLRVGETTVKGTMG